MGDVAVVYLEADDLGAAMGALATSDDPFDRWFRNHVRDVHGISLEDGFPPREPILHPPTCDRDGPAQAERFRLHLRRAHV